ncbi:hypothetical protein J6590_056982 [Homalodisca vitripennis]|nr:hypothetical protein J6590_056982 [Homalodisca vitripennis]
MHLDSCYLHKLSNSDSGWRLTEVTPECRGRGGGGGRSSLVTEDHAVTTGVGSYVGQATPNSGTILYSLLPNTLLPRLPKAPQSVSTSITLARLIERSD